jgi:predicted nuclease of restriction endonuclease-like (RecB) superfamily
MNEIEKTEMFDDILGMIYSAKQRAEYQVNNTIIELYWTIGEYVSNRIKKDGWGKSTVKALSEYILGKEPGIRGYSTQNIWRMKQFYETYRDKPELSTLLRENTWSNNLHIISKTKSYEEKEFYLKLAAKEKYKAKELERQIDSGYYERLLLSNGKAPSAIEKKDMSGALRDMYMLEFLDLPEPYKEHDLQKAILRNMKKFLLEFGKDFLFIDEEYHVQVGNNDY